MAAVPPPRTARARRSLTALGGFAAYGLGLSVLYATTGFGLPCPFQTFTGWECPLCGGTRLGAALLHGDVSGAFAANSLVLVGLAVLALVGVFWTVEVLGGPAVRLPDRASVTLGRLRPGHWLAVGLAVAVVYVLLRNLS